MVGITSFGAYVPILRLQKKAVTTAHAWYNPGLTAYRNGEIAMACWDEDAITMAVEASRDCLADREREGLGAVVLASTTHPFADRQNAGIVKEALGLPDGVGASDVGGSQRAGTSALLNAFRASAGGGGDILCVASEKRRPQPGSELELQNGAAAAAFVVGEGDSVADFIDGHSLSIDFVDHYRSAGQEFDYGWETRWIRDEGYLKIGPQAVAEALAKAELAASDVRHFIFATPMRGVAPAVAKKAGIAAEAVRDTLADSIGDSGAAHPLLLLAHALESAAEGEIIVVAGFGQGCDVIILRATGRGLAHAGLSVSGWLGRRRAEENYLKYLAFNGHLALEKGMRAELDQKTAHTALHRHRRGTFALIGGKCSVTGTVQYPKSPVSVAQNARLTHTQEDYPFADRRASILTYTSDRLAYSPNPPHYYGTIEFDGGGRLVMEFADIDASQVEVGAPMRMMFRIRAIDEARSFPKYFWKAVPDYLEQPAAADAAE